MGGSALAATTQGHDNTATGAHALRSNTTGQRNTGMGVMALFNNASGRHNVASGYNALGLTTGGYNIAVGSQAGCLLQSGSDNIYTGNGGVAADSGVIRIGTGSVATVNCTENHTFPAQTSTYIAGIHGVTVTGGSAIYVTSDGQLGINTSSRRFKAEIEPVHAAGDKVLKLQPVRFRYKNTDANDAQPLQYGLIAEDAAEIMPELVQYDKDGKPFAVNYQFLAPLLLATMQQQRALVMTLQQQVEALRNELKSLR